MSIRERLDISAYLVIGPENCTRPVEEVVALAVGAGFTCVQIRSKVATAREMITLLGKSAAAINKLGKSDSVALLVNDRLDVALAAREVGIKVDGVHVGQSDIPVDVCRKFLGADSIVGLSTRRIEHACCGGRGRRGLCGRRRVAPHGHEKRRAVGYHLRRTCRAG